MRPSEYRRRVSGWKPIVGHRFLADPDAVLAIVEQLRSEDRETFWYDPGRGT
jgi:hypothetical protein